VSINYDVMFSRLQSMVISTELKENQSGQNLEELFSNGGEL